MTSMKKSYLSTALAAALIGGVAAPASAVTLSPTLLGDAAVVPYYTVRDGWMTDFYIINTSAKTVAAKVRFHEALNSREVLDFIVVLSPYDMISAYIADTADGPQLNFPANSESSCVVPIPNGRNATSGYGGTLPFSALRYTGSYDDTGDARADPYTIDRAREGYFTIIEMGTSIDFDDNTTADGDPISVAYNSMHVDGLPRNCLAVENAFRVENILPTYDEFDRSENNLKVGWSVTNVNRGTQGSDSATIFANFGTESSVLRQTSVSRLKSASADANVKAALAVEAKAAAALQLYIDQVRDAGICDLDKDPTTCLANIRATYTGLQQALADASLARQIAVDNADLVNLLPVRNLISAQDPVFEEEPDLGMGDLQAYWIDADENNPVAITAPYEFGFDAITALLMHTAAINEWASNPNTGAASDFVLTSPTKHFYVDRLFTDSTTKSYQPFLGGEFKSEGGQSCDTVLVDYWNNDEVGTLDPVLPSPSPEYNLCWEVNVLHANATDSVLGAINSIAVTFPALAGQPDWNGWMRVNLADNGNRSANARHHDSLGGRKDKAFAMSLEQRSYVRDGLMAEVDAERRPMPGPQLWSGEIRQFGMPYIGFSIKERDMSIPSNAYSGIIPHSYEQGWTGEDHCCR